MSSTDIFGSSQNVNAVTGILKAITAANFINAVFSVNNHDTGVVYQLAIAIIVLWLLSLILQLGEILVPAVKKVLPSVDQQIITQRGDNILSWAGLVIVVFNIIVVILDSIRAKYQTLDAYKV